MKVAESLPRAVVLISGGGSNLQSIIDSAARGDIDLDIALVISNVDGVQGLHRARDADISTRVIRNGDFDSREQFDLALIEAIDEYAPDVVILAGFMRILTAAFAFPSDDLVQAIAGGGVRVNEA